MRRRSLDPTARGLAPGRLLRLARPSEEEEVVGTFTDHYKCTRHLG